MTGVLARIDDVGAETIVRVAGEIDIAVADELAVIFQLAAASNPQLTVDVADVTLLSACGIRILLEARERCRHAGGDLRVVGARGVVARVLTICNTGLDTSGAWRHATA